jgi:hypothetical protein
MSHYWTRRQWLATTSTAVAGNCLVGSLRGCAFEAPTAPVAIARCLSYGAELLPTLEGMLDRLGGIEKLVRGKTVAVKLNLTGNPGYRLVISRWVWRNGFIPMSWEPWCTYWAKLELIVSGCWKAHCQQPSLWRSTCCRPTGNLATS